MCLSPGAWLGVTPRRGSPAPRCGRSTPTIVARAARMDTRATTACLSLPAPGPAPGSRHGGRGKGSRRVRGARGLLFSQRTGLYPSVSGLASPAQAQSTTGSTVPREPAALGGQVTDCRASVTTPAGDTGGSWVRCTVVVTGTGERAQTTGPDSSQREPASGPPAPWALTAPPGGQRTPHPPHSAPRGVWGVPGQLRSVPAHSRPLRLSPLCPTLWWLSALCDRNHRQCRSQKEPLLPCQGSRSGQSRATLVAAKGLAPPGFPLPRRPRPAPGACWSRRTPSGDLPGGRRRAGRARASQEKHSFSRRHCTVTSQRCRRHTLSARHAGNLGDSVSL